MFNRRLIKTLEETILALRSENASLRSENSKLTERLLLKAGVPPVVTRADAEVDVKSLERMLSSVDIFGEDDIDEELEIIDNRKESQSEFAS